MRVTEAELEGLIDKAVRKALDSKCKVPGCPAKMRSERKGLCQEDWAVNLDLPDGGIPDFAAEGCLWQATP